MTESQYSWVTVARFFSPNEALFFKNILEGHDIPAFVPNEYMGHLNFQLLFAMGGVQLKVPSDRVEEAKELLELGEDFESEECDDEYGGEVIEE